MPAITFPSVPHYVAPPTTSEDCEYQCNVSCDALMSFPSSITVEWADLPIIDISKAHTREGRAELAPQMHDAMRTHGFLYIVNHGITQTEVRCFSNR